jgi:hypothetical protein
MRVKEGGDTLELRAMGGEAEQRDHGDALLKGVALAAGFVQLQVNVADVVIEDGEGALRPG